MKRLSSVSPLALAVAMLVCLCAAASAETVSVYRDTWGVAHVFAQSDEGAFFGAGYATASDRLFQMHRNRRAIQGRLAELVGMMGPGGNTTAAQDKDMRYRGFYRNAQEVVTRLDCQTLRLLQAYCNGVNQYIEDHQGGLLYLFGTQTPEPWTPVDCLATWNRTADYFSGFPGNEAGLLHQFEDLVASLGSVEAAVAAMAPAPIYDDSAAVVQPGDLGSQRVQDIYDYADSHETCRNPFVARASSLRRQPIPKFSHAWVVGGARTTTGSAVLHSDPQTQIEAPAIWHEIHVAGSTFNCRGIGIAGCSGFLVGFNESIAWGLSALGPDHEDLYRLKMVGPNQYEYDGVVYSMSVSNETIVVKNGSPIPITVKSTHLGPVVTALLPPADVEPGEEYILKAVPQFDLDRHTVQACIAMMRSTDIPSFTDAIALWRGPGANCVFGDSAGNIGYYTIGALPLRSPCSPLGGFIAQDGSSSDFEWVESIPMNVRPHVINPPAGALFTGNHLPIGSWYPIPLGLGTGGHGDTARSWRLRERLIETGPAVFTPQQVLDVHYDDICSVRRELVRAALHARDDLGMTFTASATGALNLLGPWYATGAHSSTGHPYFSLAFHLGLTFRLDTAPALTPIYGGAENGLCNFLKTLKQRLDADPVGAPISSDEKAFLDLALSTAWTNVRNFYGTNPAGWQAAFAAGPGTLKVPYFNTKEGFGPLDPTKNQTWPGLQNPDGSTIWSQAYESYSHWVSLSDADDSLAILPTGLSEDPDSAHFDDQAPMVVAGTLRAAPLTLAAVQAISQAPEVLTVVSPLSGDMNLDGVVTPADIQPFVSALLGSGAPVGDSCPADVNGDAALNGADIAVFLRKVI